MVATLRQLSLSGLSLRDRSGDSASTLSLVLATTAGPWIEMDMRRFQLVLDLIVESTVLDLIVESRHPSGS